VIGDRQAEIITQFPMDVDERRWPSDATGHGEAQTVSLASTVVRILADNHYLGLGARRETQRGEDLVVR
jgi:hypothetical protein